jgi:hypothetical protein
VGLHPSFEECAQGSDSYGQEENGQRGADGAEMADGIGKVLVVELKSFAQVQSRIAVLGTADLSPLPESGSSPLFYLTRLLPGRLSTSAGELRGQ